MTKTFTPARPIWCAGCGDFGVLEALTQGLDELAVPEYRRVIIAGIGCSGSLQNYLSLSLIHIYEPTRRYASAGALFC